jgi:hypothetical protein
MLTSSSCRVVSTFQPLLLANWGCPLPCTLLLLCCCCCCLLLLCCCLLCLCLLQPLAPHQRCLTLNHLNILQGPT